MGWEGLLPSSQEPVLSQTNLVHTTPFYLRPILMLSTHLCFGLPSGLFPNGFTTYNLYHTNKPLLLNSIVLIK
jgi:hypothetical protein